MSETWRIRRGEPEAGESLASAARRLVDAGAVRVTNERATEDDPFVFEVTDGRTPYRVVCTSRGRQLVCNCGDAILSGGRCWHLSAVRLWLRERREPAGVSKRPPPFALIGEPVGGQRVPTTPSALRRAMDNARSLVPGGSQGDGRDG